MYAIIRTGNHQYRVEPGVELLVERLPDTEAGKGVEISDVLLYAEGDDVSVGTPRVPVAVIAKCLGDEVGPKLRFVKYRRHKNYRRTYGHRQMYTRLLIERFEKKGELNGS